MLFVLGEVIYVSLFTNKTLCKQSKGNGKGDNTKKKKKVNVRKVACMLV